MYSQSTFDLRVHWSCILHGFHLIGKNHILDFTKVIGQRYIPLLQFVEVNVYLDTIAALMKEGVTGPIRPQPDGTS